MSPAWGQLVLDPGILTNMETRPLQYSCEFLQPLAALTSPNARVVQGFWVSQRLRQKRHDLSLANFAGHRGTLITVQNDQAHAR